MEKVRRSLGRIDWKLYGALLMLGLVPTVYTTVRVFFLGQMPGEWAFSIAGQLSWVNLLYEILNEAIILPLFYFVGQVKDRKEEFGNRVRTGLLLTLVVYGLLAVVIASFAEPLLEWMAADRGILAASASYIRIESGANVLAILSQFALVALVTVGRSGYLYILTGVRLVLCLVLDTFLVSGLPCSANLGVNGIGYSNILVNGILFAVSLWLMNREGIRVFSGERLRFGWVKKFLSVGGVSGLESLVRNVAYMVMIARMVNVVGEQGTYWVANNFIWGWLLLPVLQLGELIKRETAADQENIGRNTLGYFAATAVIVAVWFLTVPLWKPFMAKILGFGDVDKLFGLVMLLVGFYVLYAVQNVCDSIFYGAGRTDYMLLESVVTNTVYYGAAFVAYCLGLWTPTLTGIALLFGIGNAFDSLVSFGAFAWFLRKRKIRIVQ